MQLVFTVPGNAMYRSVPRDWVFSPVSTVDTSYLVRCDDVTVRRAVLIRSFIFCICFVNPSVRALLKGCSALFTLILAVNVFISVIRPLSIRLADAVDALILSK